jgi:hypothetical protein
MPERLQKNVALSESRTVAGIVPNSDAREINTWGQMLALLKYLEMLESNEMATGISGIRCWHLLACGGRYWH